MSSDDWDALGDLAFLSECHQRNAELCGIAGILLAANLGSKMSEERDEDDPLPRPRTRSEREDYREQKIRERSFRRKMRMDPECQQRQQFPFFHHRGTSHMQIYGIRPSKSAKQSKMDLTRIRVAPRRNPYKFT